MELREYQKRAVAQVQTYLRALSDVKKKAEDAGFSGLDFAAEAWRKVAPGINYRSRRDGMDQSIPAFCLKIPTGGGKTLLAVKCIDAVNTLYLKRRTGLVLWVVPTAQIYNQTLASLRDRQHPYRQHLDIASAGRTVVIEKHERFSPFDVNENLVVLLLMLPSANRVSKEQLRMFQDNGGFELFFPSEEAHKEHADLLKRVPNLDTFAKDGFWGTQVKTSLGNTLRTLRPLLVVDEGQKAYSLGAQATLNGFNPSVLIELSATPPENSNILVDIKGTVLAQEEMIKLPLNVVPKRSPQWYDTLMSSVEQRDALEKIARKYEATSGRYIRPICLVQVERTGKDQREKGFVHADDVKERLIKAHGVSPEEIAIKSSSQDDLKEVDDIGGLLARDCQIRYIITKQALQEGWDCSFAYVLAVLTNPLASMSMTQLVGRVLRQPYARKTNVTALDEAYVFCHRPNAGALLTEIRNGLSGEGLKDLTSSVVLTDPETKTGTSKRTAKVRSKFSKAFKTFVLPVFAINAGGAWRPVRYETDVESRIPWNKFDVSELCKMTLSTAVPQETAIKIDMGDKARTVKRQQSVAEAMVDKEIDEDYVARHISEIVPNPWAAYDFGRKVIDCLAAEHNVKLVHDNFAFIVEELRKHLRDAKEKYAKAVFLERLKKGEMRFLLITGAGRLPAKMEFDSAVFARRDNTPLEKSLHDFVPADGFNGDESAVAWFMEEQEKLFFWYRNRVRNDYSIQGWRKERFWPDFVFSTGKKDALDKVYVVETKGEHLAGNEDTKYKQALVELCNAEMKRTDVRKLPGLTATIPTHFELLPMEQWEKRLREILA